jgi:hypothetical protein
LTSAGNNKPHEVIDLSDEDLSGGYHVVSRLFIGKIFRQQGQDEHHYDGYSIAMRTDLHDVENGYPRAFLFDGDVSSSLLIKDVKMSGIWAHGERVTNAASIKHDGDVDRSSILVQGNVPSHYILVHFPPGTRLKNVFTPYQSGCRQIKKISNISQLGSEVQETEKLLGHAEHPVGSGNIIEVRALERTESLHTYVEAVFCLAKGDPVTRFVPKPKAEDDEAKQLRSLFGKLKPPSGTPFPPSTGSSS